MRPWSYQSIHGLWRRTVVCSSSHAWFQHTKGASVAEMVANRLCIIFAYLVVAYVYIYLNLRYDFSAGK